MTSSVRRAKRPGEASQVVTGLEQWKLEDAKARLSEVVRRASTAGPQLVTVRGREAAVVLTPEQYRQLLPKPKGHVPLQRFLQDLGLSGISLERENDTGREVDL
jgi:prevent-host-death family protein